MKNKSVALILIVAFLLSGCATSPDRIKPAYVSPLQYYGLSCEQIQQEMIRVNSRLEEVCGVQRRKAGADAAAVTVGMLIFWPALFFLAGGDRKEEVARLKGEYIALEQAAIHNNCAFGAELQKAREELEKEEERKEQEKREKRKKRGRP